LPGIKLGSSGQQHRRFTDVCTHSYISVATINFMPPLQNTLREHIKNTSCLVTRVSGFMFHHRKYKCIVTKYNAVFLNCPENLILVYIRGIQGLFYNKVTFSRKTTC